MRTPFKHQEKARDFLREKQKAILADCMGLGKTYSAILAANTVHLDKVIVCPASLKENWAREIVAAGVTDTVNIYDGGKAYTYQDGGDIVWSIINYDILERHIDNLRAKVGIYDEAHYIKNKGTKRTKTALRLAKQLEHLYLLTGTPIMNRPEELFTLLEAIDHELGQSWWKFVHRYCDAQEIVFYKNMLDSRGRVITDKYGKPVKRKMQFLKTTGASNLNELSLKLMPVYLRRTKDELGDKIPAKIVDTVSVQLSDEYRKKYNDAWENYIDYLESDPKVSQRKMVNAQMARHLIELGKLKQLASTGKIDRMVEDISEIVEQGEKVLVFSGYNDTISALQRKLQAKKIKSVTLTGSDDMRSRTASVDAIQEGDTPVFIGNIQAAGVGLTLTAANTVLFADMAWTPAQNAQAEDRAHRIGQHKQVNVHYYLAENTVDQDIADLLEVKQKVIDEILEGGEATGGDITADLVRKIVAKNKG